ncbi:MAG: hypothetical protein JW976_14085 [Syntrophaceae bacterium]|nr:hypothetical protein [Syntrophaceae bacterium]
MSPELIDSFAYTHDPVGNRLTKTDSGKTINYNFDPIYRLTKASPRSRTTAQLPEDIVNHHTEAYSYDPVGNRQTGPKSTDGYTYDSANELLNYSGHPNKRR